MRSNSLILRRKTNRLVLKPSLLSLTMLSQLSQGDFMQGQNHEEKNHHDVGDLLPVSRGPSLARLDPGDHLEVAHTI